VTHDEQMLHEIESRDGEAEIPARDRGEQDLRQDAHRR
jgi:hypothetical protein